MARIGIAGFLHETNTFAASRARFATFVEADAWPGLLVGEEMFRAVSGVNLAIDGFIQAAQSTHQLVPLLWASANPGGPVTEDAFEAIAFMLDRMLRDAGPLDALFLDLHGAMVSEHLDDGEGELLRRLRQRVGAALPIVVALDFHANITPAMFEYASGLLAYRSYPHIDMAQTGQRAQVLLDRLLGGRVLHKAYRQLPFLIPMPWQSTLIEPMRGLVALGNALASEQVFAAELVPGFPLADIYHSGPTVLAYGHDAIAVERAAEALAQAALARQAGFGGRLYAPDEAVAYALQHALRPGYGTVILADTQDNPGGGGSGDTTDILHELLRQNAQRVCVGVLCDAAFAEAATRAGVGAVIEFALGAVSGTGAPPLYGPFEVLALGSGRFTGTGPFYLGCHMDLGAMARVRCGGSAGIEIVVSSRKQQAADRAMFRHIGADPADYRILVLKSSVHFRADFAALADDILVVAAPGANVADLRQLRYEKLRPGVALL
ncbi:microcystin degradation protein MlrC [Paraburkholderia sp. GAS41]|uniref:M81 family metallopeptidase n=1 Tax=Paraburkholderia sp. GAS41 TaxID=3035134 RepID=UPI003D1ED899